MSEADEWTVQWQYFNEDGVHTCSGGGSKGLSWDTAKRWIERARKKVYNGARTSTYSYKVIHLLEAQSLRKQFPSNGGAGWFIAH
mgnify:FL=1